MKNVPNNSIRQKRKQNVNKILVIENDPDHVFILEQLFAEQGYEYKIYDQVPDIHAIVKEFEPDLVLLDYILPRINGGELCSQLKRENDTKEIPVVIYSAAPKAFLSLGDYGCDLFIPKPFDFDEFISKISRLINIHSLS